jgi:prophage regulatory protein
MEQTMKLLDYDALADKGIKFSDTHIWRLIRAGDFPKPVKIGNRNHWVETEIDDYIAAKLRMRDKVEAA